MSDDDWAIIDRARTAGLCDVGAPGFYAATVVSPDGSEHLILAQLDSLGDEAARYHATCPDAIHEHLGPLPLEIVRRIAIAQRKDQR